MVGHRAREQVSGFLTSGVGENKILMGRGFYWVMEIFKNCRVVMTVHHCEYTKCH
jgi:hypothetical protein